MKKKLFLILAAVAVCGILFACGESVSAPEDEDGEIVIGMSQVGAESDWRVANSESMKAVFSEQNGYRLLFDDARQKQENQFGAIRRFIQQQVDYIVVMPISETGWDSVLQEAYDAGIPVIVVDRMVDVKDESLITAHVGADFYAEGEKATSWMAGEFSGKDTVNIVHIQGTLGSTAQVGRTAALEDGLAVHQNWQLIARLDGGFTQAQTRDVLRQYILSSSGHPEIDVVYCENDNMAYAAIEVLESFGYTCGESGVKIISFDAVYDALCRCRDGKIALEVECNPLLGPLVASIVETMEQGGIPEKNHYVEETVFQPNDITDELLNQREY